MDGKRISTAGIVLRPGERVFLERYIDSNNKFLFSTYTVNGENKQVQQAIKSNGNLKVEFYDVYVPISWPNQIYYGSTITTGGTIGGSTSGTFYYNDSTLTSTTATPTFGTTSMTNAFASYSAEIPSGPIARSASNGEVKASFKKSKSIETGTVEKGEVSKQDFEYTYDNFNSYTCNIVDWKILPVSQKPVTTDEIKVFCTGCGTRKRKQSHKFCPSCGTQYE